MRVALLAPVDTSLYAILLAAKFKASRNLELSAVVVRTMLSVRRIHSELNRDGSRLVLKVRDKLVLRRETLSAETGPTLRTLADEMGVQNTVLSHWCRQVGVPFHLVRDHNAISAVEILRAANPDVIAFTGGGLIRSELLQIAARGVLNCHMGILPRYRGMDVVEWPVIEDTSGSPEIGLTTHFMDPGIDTGPILLQKRFSPEPGETFARLRHRMEREMVLLSYDTLERLATSTLEPQAQRAEDGRQYFVMHPRMLQLANEKLQQITG